jgi:hypothetical protein
MRKSEEKQRPCVRVRACAVRSFSRGLSFFALSLSLVLLASSLIGLIKYTHTHTHTYYQHDTLSCHHSNHDLPMRTHERTTERLNAPASALSRTYHGIAQIGSLQAGLHPHPLRNRTLTVLRWLLLLLLLRRRSSSLPGVVVVGFGAAAVVVPLHLLRDRSDHGRRKENGGSTVGIRCCRRTGTRRRLRRRL